jgi:subtilase family serine protease
MQKKAFIPNAGLLAVVIILATAFFSPIAASGQPITQQTLHGHVPPAITRLHLQSQRDLPNTNRLSLAISLPLNNEAGLDQLIQQIYDPASPDFHHYLTPDQFTAQFGPSQQDYDTVINFLKAKGLAVITTYSNRTLVDVSGDTATINNAFHVALRVYQHPTENRTFFAPDTDPTIDAGIPISHITGLDNLVIPHPLAKIGYLGNNSSGVTPAYGTGSGPVGQYLGKDFRAAYLPGVTLDGTGQKLALFELDAFYPSDITNYEQMAGLPYLTVTNIPVNGGVSTPGSADGEVSLDIELAIAMATNLSAVLVYEAPNGGGNSVIDLLQRIASDNQAKQVSSSWAIGDSSSYDTYYKQMASQGQSFFQASGDDGAFFNGIEQWADDTNITIVGGTTLNTTGAGGSWSSETAWNWYIDAPPNTNSTGGGTNFNGILIPGWQQGISMATNQGSTTLRNVPDVALTADNIYVYYNQGNFSTSSFFGGTSCAAPLWAAFTALVNEQATNNNLPPVGFLNPAIYAIGKSANYTNDFHDITAGNNTNSVVTGKYSAVPGYDLCTGWGTPNGQNLINALANPLSIVPNAGFTAVGQPGGPFATNSQNYVLTNLSTASISWSLINTSAWLTTSISNGTLAVNGATNLTVSLTAAAASLGDGNYCSTLTFTDLVSGIVQTLPFNLQILDPLVVTPASGFNAAGPAGGPFTPNSQNYTLTNLNSSVITWSLINTSAWLTASSIGGTLAGDGTNAVTVSLTAAAANLAIGNYSSTLTFTDSTFHASLSFQYVLQVTEPLVAGPAAGFTISGPVGGPFSATSETYSLTNLGGAPLNWQATTASTWFNLSPASGTLFGGGTATVTASLNASSASLPAGIYNGQISLTDETSGNTLNCPLTLSVGQSIVLNGNFGTGDLTDWTLFGPSSSNFVTAGVTAIAPPTGNSYVAVMGASTFSVLQQTLPTTVGQRYVLSFLWTNPGSNSKNRFQVNWNTNGTMTNTIFNQSSVSRFSTWQNKTFVLTATGPSTILQFGANNNNYYFGLDDIYVWPIPVPIVTSALRAGKGSFSMTWNTMTNISYVVQYSTNLLSTNWFNLATNTATGPTLTVTNSTATNRFLFYRIGELP